MMINLNRWMFNLIVVVAADNTSINKDKRQWWSNFKDPVPTPHPGKKVTGHEAFFEDMVVLDPVADQDWVCGSTVSIKWNPGSIIRTKTVPEGFPQPPKSGKANIYLARGKTPLLGKITANAKLIKLRIGSNVDLMAGKSEFHVDCQKIPELCPTCLNWDGSVKTNKRYSHTWDYLLFEDIEPADTCPKNQLNYDQIDCWTLRGEGAVWVSTEEYKAVSVPFDEGLNPTDGLIWTEGKYSWMAVDNDPPGNHLYGIAVAVTYFSSFWMPKELPYTPTLPFGYGEWSMEFRDIRGIISNTVWKSNEENVIVVSHRATINGPNAYEDWMTNFSFHQRSCKADSDGQQPIYAGCDENIKFHRGFMNEYIASQDGIRETVLRLVKNESPCEADDPTQWRIIFTGMSQGAGTCQHSLYDLHNLLKEELTPDQFGKIQFFLYNFGGPPGGSRLFAEWIEDNIPKTNRERFVNRYNTSNPEDFYGGSIHVEPLGMDKIGWILEGDLGPCMNSVPPYGSMTPPYANWKWKEPKDTKDDSTAMHDNAAFWLTGDLITLITTWDQCSAMDENNNPFVCAKLNIDSRYDWVCAPEFIHFDPDMFMPWCSADGCKPHPTLNWKGHENAKQPRRVYTDNMIPYSESKYNKVAGEDHRCVNKTGGIMSSFSCHNLQSYSYATSLFNKEPYLVDWNTWKYNGEKNSGCKATGKLVRQEEVNLKLKPKPIIPSRSTSLLTILFWLPALVLLL